MALKQRLTALDFDQELLICLMPMCTVVCEGLSAVA